jgi:hypothetical protein
VTKVISRKFFVAVLTVVWLLVDRQYALATGLATAYCGLQGFLDHVHPEA